MSHELDMKCLFSPNWLTAELIDSYMKLLQKLDSDIFIFETVFYKTFEQTSYETLSTSFKKEQIVNYTKIYIPIYEENHCYLVTCDKSEISLLDPYNFPGVIEKDQQLKQNHQNHMKFLMKLKECYFKLLYADYNLKCPDFKLSVLLPPELPPQNSSHDCGVFLAMFVKYLIQNNRFDFDSDSMIRVRETMRMELIEMKITGTKHDVNQSKVDLKKRKISVSAYEKQASKIPKIHLPNQGLYRTFRNIDLESCWINSCLQFGNTLSG